jgi:hypothetical protein
MACIIIAVIVAMTLRENAENDNPWRLIMVCMGGMITGGIGEIYPNLIDIITVLFLIILTFGSIVIIAAGKSKMVES